MFNFNLLVPEMVMLGMTCIVLLADLLIKQKQRTLTYSLTQLTLVAVAVLTIVNYHIVPETGFSGLLIADRLSDLLRLTIILTSIFVFMYSRSYIRQHQIPQGEFYLLGLFSILGMMVLTSAHNFLTLYLGLELMSLPIYAMVALLRDKEQPIEAAMKYFVLGALASGFILYGMSMIYGATQSLDVNQVASAIAMLPANEMYILVVGLVFIVAGLAFKLGLVPFHMWLPDVYQGAPTAVTLFITVAPKVAGFALVIRLLVDAMPGLYVQWQELLIVLSVLSMVLGNVAAITQTNIKRMFAYSTIAHGGYMLLGLAAASSIGFSAAMFYTIFYAIMSLGGFGIITLLTHQGIDIESIDDLKGLNSRSPWLAFMFLLVLFSMAGIPPTVGFFAKLGVLEAVVSAHLVWLACLAIILAVIGSYYYLRVVKVMYFDEATQTTPIILPLDTRIAVSINGLAMIALGLFPSSIIDVARAVFLG
ncbi:MAG: NADH-quinone oxidoreductase subunit NuoN [Gammaproteobacteria bacterium]|nr:NADH-quinone oxidoreductase subunit NuoN [Gammaproteobacteria bacterium]